MPIARPAEAALAIGDLAGTGQGLPRSGGGPKFEKNDYWEKIMFDDDAVKKRRGHEVGMPIETMSVEELEERIAMLNAEIARLQQAIAAREKTRSEAESRLKH